MFSLLTGVYDSYLAPSQLNLLVVGPAGSGKTALLERLKVTHFPKRPASNAAATLSSPPPLTPELHAAFVEGGAQPLQDDETAGSATTTTTTTTAVSTRTTTSNAKPPKPPTANVPPKPATSKAAPPPPPATPVTKTKTSGLFGISFCPAPKRYSKTNQDQEEEYLLDDAQPAEEEGEEVLAPSGDADADADADADSHDTFDPTVQDPMTPEAPQRVRCHSHDLGDDDMEDVPLSSNHPISSLDSIPMQPPPLPTLSAAATKVPQNEPAPRTPKQDSKIHNSLLLQHRSGTPQEFNLKPKSKMLPLSKIRPTIGTNLGKMEIYGAKCHFFDVGGRLHDLWERYYEDCDAVIFCWQLGDDPDRAVGDDDDDDDAPMSSLPPIELLNQVRASISDDIPFLVWGHVFGAVDPQLVDTMYATDPLFPRYHNNLTGLCCGSAKTGAGVLHAMDWLIPLAKQQQKERLAARKKLEEKLS